MTKILFSRKFGKDKVIILYNPDTDNVCIGIGGDFLINSGLFYPHKIRAGEPMCYGFENGYGLTSRVKKWLSNAGLHRLPSKYYDIKDVEK